MNRPARALIDLAAFRHNYLLAQKLSGCPCYAVVKADAYGHGMAALVNSLPEANGFAVSRLEETVEFAPNQGSVLVLSGPMSEAELVEMAARGIQTMIHTPQQVEWVSRFNGPQPLHFWLKFDTGMHRLGLMPENAEQWLAMAAGNPQAKLLGIATHLACADDPASNFTPRQLAAFAAATVGFSGPRSIANSAAIMQWPESHTGWARPGIMLYGSSPFGWDSTIQHQLQPVMTLVSEVIALRDVAAGECVGYGNSWRAERPTRVATVAMGYGDGYPRHAPSGTPVVVENKRAALIGRVSMDLITLDVTDIPAAQVGSQVEFWGKQLSVDEVAHHVGTIGYELLTRVSPRVERVPG